MTWEALLKTRIYGKKGLNSKDIAMVDYIMKDGVARTIDKIFDDIYDMINKTKKLGNKKSFELPISVLSTFSVSLRCSPERSSISFPMLSVLKRLRDKGLLEGLPKGLVALKDKDKDKVQVKDIDKRKEGFEKEVIEIAKTKKYDIREVEKFVSYWTEPNRSGKKMLFEMRQVFHIPRRLATWFKNSFNNKKGVNNERKQMHFTGS